jgi:hypothetical protein
MGAEEVQLLKDWAASNPSTEAASAVRLDVSTLLRSFGKVVLTNNAVTGRNTYPEIRERCHVELDTFIRSRTVPVRPKPVSLMDFLLKVLGWWQDVYYDVFKLGQKSARCIGATALSCLSEKGVSTYCGECPVCLEELEFTSTAWLQPCKHCLHHKCLQQLPERKCPMCRESITGTSAYEFLREREGKKIPKSSSIWAM